MRPLAVVDAEPGIRQSLEFRGRVEEMGVQYFGAIRAIEALDVRVLIRLARLNIVNRHTMGAQSTNDCARNLGPLSTRTATGAPCTVTRSSSTRTTRRLGSEIPTAISNPSRFPSLD